MPQVRVHSLCVTWTEEYSFRSMLVLAFEFLALRPETSLPGYDLVSTTEWQKQSRQDSTC